MLESDQQHAARGDPDPQPGETADALAQEELRPECDHHRAGTDDPARVHGAGVEEGEGLHGDVRAEDHSEQQAARAVLPLEQQRLAAHEQDQVEQRRAEREAPRDERVGMEGADRRARGDEGGAPEDDREPGPAAQHGREAEFVPGDSRRAHLPPPSGGISGPRSCTGLRPRRMRMLISSTPSEKAIAK
jgi:hypothetical protein